MMLVDERYDYKYPKGMNLQPDSEMHKKLVTQIKARADASYLYMTDRHDSYQKVDEMLTAYIPLDDEEKKVQEEDERQAVSIVIPYSYAMLETMLSYWGAAFFEPPILRYEGVAPEDMFPSILLEHVVDVQMERGKAQLALYIQCRDALAYGIGAVALRFGVKKRKKTVTEPTGFMNRLGDFIRTGKTRRTRKAIEFEGTLIDNIDPYNYLPDPSVPIHRIQDGEFIGWIENTNRMEVLSFEKDNEGVMFNAKYLKHIEPRSIQADQDRSGRGARNRYKLMDRSDIDNEVVNPVDVTHMYVKLVPDEWEIGDSQYPEKWYFALAGDEVIIGAAKLEDDHDMFPVAVMTSNLDGYQAAPLSVMEMLYGSQHRLDWLFNSRQANVRKAVNDVVIYDPGLIDTRRLKNAGPGGLVPTRKRAWGKGIDGAITQLKINDVTQGHINDAGVLMNIMERVTAATDSLQGVNQRLGERVTRYQVQSTRQSAFTRQESRAYVASIMAITDIGKIFASNTQQYMSEKTWVKILGKWQEVLARDYGIDPNSRLPVHPFDLICDYDVKPSDGSVVGSEYLETWMNLIQTIAANPGIAVQAGLDIGRVFRHFFRMTGLKDIESFISKTQAMPDQALQAEAQAGNVRPIPGGLGL